MILQKLQFTTVEVTKCSFYFDQFRICKENGFNKFDEIWIWYLSHRWNINSICLLYVSTHEFDTFPIDETSIRYLSHGWNMSDRFRSWDFFPVEKMRIRLPEIGQARMTQHIAWTHFSFVRQIIDASYPWRHQKIFIYYF